jgi:pimeloyl-ACP methyl ester carboxylesterase
LKKHIVIISGWAGGPDAFKNISAKPGNSGFLYLPWEKCVTDPDFAVAFIKALGRKITVIAWSLGVLAAIKAATSAPELVEELFLISGTARMTADADYTGASGRDIKAMAARLEKHREAVIKGFVKNCFNPGHEGEPEFLLSAGGFSVLDLAAGLEYLEKTDVRNLLSGVKAPTVIMHGLKDKIIPFSQAEHMHRHINGSVLKSFDAGHNLPYILDHEAINPIGGI